MKKIMVNFVAALIIVFGGIYLFLPTYGYSIMSCTSSCSYGGCDVELAQTQSNWVMAISCDGTTTEYAGTGDYSGTICGGATPCSL